MDTRTVIIILAIILLILIILNHVKIVKVDSQSTNTTTTTSTTKQGSCSQTVYGCCPDGVNSKINYLGSNCPGYRPPPGYPLKPYIPPPLPPKV